MKKKNTIIIALIALFIFSAGVKSVSADHVINKAYIEKLKEERRNWSEEKKRS